MQHAAVILVSGEKNNPWEMTPRNISFQNTKSGAGEQFLLLDCGGKAPVKGVSFSQTPVKLSRDDDVHVADSVATKSAAPSHRSGCRTCDRDVRARHRAWTW